ncbi:reverse transcriptase domain-containing protein [Tanacetum coccineum]|uniref:Reverse transcriptase domain-containing protein n=1 Tax=Tanacetum coccineum TaxID=301880 RepID=A0ABQ5GDP6_9ASTR
MVKTGLIKAIDSFVPLDEHLATFRGYGYSRKGTKRKPKPNKAKHGKERTKSSRMAMRNRSQAVVYDNNNQVLRILFTPQIRMADTSNYGRIAPGLPPRDTEDANVILKSQQQILEIMMGCLLNSCPDKQFSRTDKRNHTCHIDYFNKITSTLRYPNVPTNQLVMLFPYFYRGRPTRIWLEKEPPRSIQTWDDLVAKFINQFFPPSKTTNLRNEITNFKQRFDESFSEAWDRFKDLLPRHVHTWILGAYHLDIITQCLNHIGEQSKVRHSRSKAIVAKVSTSASTSGVSPDVAELKDYGFRDLLLVQADSPVQLRFRKAGF